jgi:hypothetical protein
LIVWPLQKIHFDRAKPLTGEGNLLRTGLVRFPAAEISGALALAQLWTLLFE